MEAIGSKRSTAATLRRTTTAACMALVGLVASASAQSGPVSIVARENPAAPGAFSLNFGELGLETSGNITTTTYELSVDPIQGTAHFVSYLQHVQPLILPGGISTGDIVVEIVAGSSTGTYDPFTRTFHTSEMYAVHFSGDLSAYGLTSPALLPSSSVGALVVDPLTGGEVVMDWSGNGDLDNPFDPGSSIPFTYRCAVNTLFPARPASVVGLALIPDVASLHLPPAIASNLLILLDETLTAIEQGKKALAVQDLRTFIRKVKVLGGRVIAESDAARLVLVAQQAIDLFGPAKFR